MADDYGGNDYGGSQDFDNDYGSELDDPDYGMLADQNAYVDTAGGNQDDGGSYSYAGGQGGDWGQPAAPAAPAAPAEPPEDYKGQKLAKEAEAPYIASEEAYGKTLGDVMKNYETEISGVEKSLGEAAGKTVADVDASNTTRLSELGKIIKEQEEFLMGSGSEVRPITPPTPKREFTEPMPTDANVPAIVTGKGRKSELKKMIQAWQYRKALFEKDEQTRFDSELKAEQTRFAADTAKVEAAKKSLLDAKKESAGLIGQMNKAGNDARNTYTNVLIPAAQSGLERYDTAQKNADEAYGRLSKAAIEELERRKTDAANVEKEALTLGEMLDPNNRVAQSQRELYEQTRQKGLADILAEQQAGEGRFAGQAEGVGRRGMADTATLMALGQQAAAQQFGTGPSTGAMQQLALAQQGRQSSQAYAQSRQKMNELQDQQRAYALMMGERGTEYSNAMRQAGLEAGQGATERGYAAGQAAKAQAAGLLGSAISREQALNDWNTTRANTPNQMLEQYRSIDAAEQGRLAADRAERLGYQQMLSDLSEKRSTTSEEKRREGIASRASLAELMTRLGGTAAARRAQMGEKNAELARALGETKYGLSNQEVLRRIGAAEAAARAEEARIAAAATRDAARSGMFGNILGGFFTGGGTALGGWLGGPGGAAAGAAGGAALGKAVTS